MIRLGKAFQFSLFCFVCLRRVVSIHVAQEPCNLITLFSVSACSIGQRKLPGVTPSTYQINLFPISFTHRIYSPVGKVHRLHHPQYERHEPA